MTLASAPPQFILASASPRREHLLRDAGYVFHIDPADIDESDHPPDLAPEALAELLAQRKAQTVARRHPGDVVLAADTIVALGPAVFGKPVDVTDARRMLCRLGGTTHKVISAIAVARMTPALSSSALVVSGVQMRLLSDREIDDYIASGAWSGKAGGYGIQDNDPFVTRMTGSLTNIVGLPMDETRGMLSRAGILPRHSPAA